MPVYGSQTAVQTLDGGRPVVVWDNELLPTTSPGNDPGLPGCSVAVGLNRSPIMANCLSVELEFSGNPGTFELVLQTADTNADKYFVTKTNLKEAVDHPLTGRMELVNVVAKFVRLKMYTLSNAVRVTARVF